MNYTDFMKACWPVEILEKAEQAWDSMNAAEKLELVANASGNQLAIERAHEEICTKTYRKDQMTRLEQAIAVINVVYTEHGGFTTPLLKDGNFDNDSLDGDREYALATYKNDDLKQILAVIDGLKAINNEDRRIWAVIAAEERYFCEPPGSRYWKAFQ